VSYGSERGKQSSSCSDEYCADHMSSEVEKDSEIHISLCLNAFEELQPSSLSQMREIFARYYVTYDKMCQVPNEVINDPDLVV